MSSFLSSEGVLVIAAVTSSLMDPDSSSYDAVKGHTRFLSVV